MKESTKKIVTELLESELHAVGKGLYFVNAAIKTAEAEKNTSVVETQNRLKKARTAAHRCIAKCY